MNKNLFKAITAFFIFAVLHFFGHSDMNQLPIITSLADPPVTIAIDELEVLEETRPSYLSPFQKFERKYVEKGSSNVVIIENKDPIVFRKIANYIIYDAFNGPREYFGPDEFDIVYGSIEDYHKVQEYPDSFPIYPRGLTGPDNYANHFFYLIQYFLIFSGFYYIIKSIKTSV